MSLQDLERVLDYAKKIRADVDSAIRGIEYLIARERGKGGLTSLESVEMYPKCGILIGDRVQSRLDGRIGVVLDMSVRERDATVGFDNGSKERVMWDHLRKLEPGELREGGKTTGQVKSKPYTKMTDDELATELQTLEIKQSQATGWGAAVGVRGEYIDEIKREQRRRQGAGKSNGANGMRPGDRVQYAIDGRTGVAKEFLQDGDATVRFDDGKVQEVKWNHLRKLEPLRAEDTYGGLRPNTPDGPDGEVIARWNEKRGMWEPAVRRGK